MATNWPSAVEYRDALQHPSSAFKDAALKSCRAEVNKMGVPRARAGAFANVYKLMQGSNPYAAVRVFLYENSLRAGRYDLVSKHLNSKRPRCIVDFKYFAEGILVNKVWYPILTMQWVRGLSLGEWVRQTVVSKDTAKIARMADLWGQLVEDLGRHEIAHGDLQHDNVMVVNDEPLLVDYDCMCVPALVGEPALENGKPAYQHPDREKQSLSLDLDRFSAWIILIALRALSFDLSLYQRYNESTKNENLLFSEADIRHPHRSALWKELLAFKDPDVRDWSRRIHETLPPQPFDRIPPFELDPFAPLRKESQATPLRWDVIHALAVQVAAKRPLPADLGKVAQEAGRRVVCRDAVEQAVKARSLVRLADAYKPDCLDDWLACANLVARGRDARKLLPQLRDLETAQKNVGGGRGLVDLWRKHGPGLKDFIEADPIARDVQGWEARIRACDDFLRLLRATPVNEKDLADAWKKLDGLKGHPDAAPHRDRAQDACRRADLAALLRPLMNPATEPNDRRFRELLKKEAAVLTGWTEARTFQDHDQQAEKRLAAYDALVAAVSKADAGTAAEQDIVAAARLLPGNYAPAAFAARIALASERVQAWQDLEPKRTARPLLDVPLADAFDKARKAFEQPPAGCKARPLPLAPADRTTCETALKRRDCLNRLLAVDKSLAAVKQDEQWLALWDKTLLDPCEDAKPHRPRRDLAERRQKALTALLAVIAQADQGKAEEAQVVSASTAVDKGYAPPEVAARVVLAGQRVQAWQDLDQKRKARPLLDVPLADAFDKARKAFEQPPAGCKAARPLPLAPADRTTCETALKRRDCLNRLLAVDKSLAAVKQDEQWLALWDKTLLDPCEDAKPHRPRRDLAERRQKALAALLAVIAQADQGNAEETAVQTAERAVDRGYAPAEVAARVALAGQRVQAWQELDRRLRARPLSDEKLAEAWEKVQQLFASPPAGGRARPLPPLAAPDQKACALAVQRRDCLAALKKIDPQLPAHKQDKFWLNGWKEPLLQGCHDAAPLKDRITLARDRALAWKQLLDALQKEDPFAVRDAFADKILKGYPPVVARKARISGLIDVANLLDRILHTKGRPGEPPTFTADDLDQLRQNEKIILAHWQHLGPLLEQWASHLALSPSEPLYESAGEDMGPYVYWQCPYQGLVSSFRVAADPQRFYARPTDVPNNAVMAPSWQQYEQVGGMYVPPLGGHKEIYVTVWAAVDFGEKTLYGPPLKLGPVPVDGGAGGWW